MKPGLRAGCAALLLGALVAGIPLALGLTIGNPLAGWADLRAGDVSDTVLLDVLAATAWTAWAQFAVVVLSESVALVRGRSPAGRQGSREGLSGQRHLARTLLTAAFVLVPAIAPVPAMAAAHSPGVVSTTRLPTSAATGTVTAGLGAQPAGATSDTPDPATESPTPEPTPASADGPEVVIRVDGPGTYWGLAETYLGDGQRWAQIWDLNRGRRQRDGAVMSSPALLQVGWTVLLPASALTATDAVVDGHSRSGPQPPARQLSSLTYRVAEGDRLGAIAERFLGDFDEFAQIRSANPALIPDSTGSRGPDHIQPGWRLTLPPAARDRGALRHAAGRPGSLDPQTPGPAPAAGDQPGSASPRTPGRPTPRPPGRTGPVQRVPPAPTPTAVASPAPAASSDPSRTASARAVQGRTVTTHRPSRLAGDTEPGATLPGGGLEGPLAAALTATGALVVLRRRRRHRHADDSDLDEAADGGGEGTAPALPAVLTSVRRAVAQHAVQVIERDVRPASHEDPATGHERGARPGPSSRGGIDPHEPAAWTGQAVTRRQSDDGEDPLAVLSRSQTVQPAATPGADRGLDLMELHGRAPTGMGLEGPGAPGAARALLVAALGTDPQRPDPDRVRVVVTAQTLAELLQGTALPPGQAIAGLRVAVDLTQALIVVDAHLLERRRLLEERDSIAAPADPPDPCRLPPLLLLASAPPPALGTRVLTTARLGAELGFRAVLLSTWPAGQTLTVSADGRILDPARAGRHTAACLGAGTSVSVLGVQATWRALQALTPTHTPHVTREAQQPRPVPSAPGRDRSELGPAAAVETPRQSPENHRDGTETEPTPAKRAISGTADSSDVSTGTPDGKVRVRLLGPPTVLDRHGHPVPTMRQHATQLLVYLAVHRSGARLRDIMEVLWPEATVRRAGDRLSTEVANLRRNIRQAAADPTIQPVINTGGHYHLDADVLEIDLWTFEDHLREVPAAADLRHKVAQLRAAVSAHTGALAEGRDYQWAEAHRESLRREGIRARVALADLTAPTDPDKAAALAEEAADLDSRNEELAQRAIRALTAIGDHEGVRRRFQRHRDALDEIQEVPSEQTLALVRSSQS